MFIHKEMSLIYCKIENHESPTSSSKPAVHEIKPTAWRPNGSCTTNHHHYHHHMSVMELGHLLTRSGLTYLEASSEVCHDSFCQLGNSVSLSWVVCHEAFCLQIIISRIQEKPLTISLSWSSSSVTITSEVRKKTTTISSKNNS